MGNSRYFHTENIKSCKRCIDAYQALSKEHPKYKNIHDQRIAELKAEMKAHSEALKKLDNEQEGNNQSGKRAGR